MEVVQRENEPRFVYLMRVAANFIYTTCPEGTIKYDESICDGYCLSAELEDEVDKLYERV
ncbi:MAG: hypothetical protein ACOCZ5_01615 [bacterium]